MRRRSLATLGLTAGALLFAGCAGSTRVAEFGPLADRHHLVRIVVSEDRDLIERECRGALAPGPIYGCQIARPVTTIGQQPARAVTIVRYTDHLPSALALEIETHEVCHAIASVQGLADPCHVGNNGLLRSVAGSNGRR